MLIDGGVSCDMFQKHSQVIARMSCDSILSVEFYSCTHLRNLLYFGLIPQLQDVKVRLICRICMSPAEAAPLCRHSPSRKIDITLKSHLQ